MKAKAKVPEPEPPSTAASSGDPPAVIAKSEERVEAKLSGSPPASSVETKPMEAPVERSEPEALTSASHLPRLLENPITPVPLPPRRRTRADEHYLYMHGRLMSTEVGREAALELEAYQPDQRGNVDMFVNFGHVTMYNKVCERRRCPDFDVALSHEFTRSLWGLFRASVRARVGSLCSPSALPQCSGRVHALDSRALFSAVFDDAIWHLIFFPTGVLTSVKSLSVSQASDEFILPLWTHPTLSHEAP